MELFSPSASRRVCCWLLLLAGGRAAAAELNEPPLTLRFGFLPGVYSNVNAKDAQLALEILVRQWMAEELRQETITKIFSFDDVEAALSALKAKQVDLMAFTTADFFRLRDKAGIEPLFTSEWNGSALDEYILVVRKTPRPRDLGRLRGKTLLIENNAKGDLPRMWLDTVLMKADLPDSAGLFRDVKEVENPSSAVLPVFFGRSDAAVVTRKAFDTMTELNPQLLESLSVAARSPGLLRSLTVIRKGADPRIKDLALRHAFTLNAKPKGKQIFMLFHVEAAVPLRPADLDEAERFFNDYLELRRIRIGNRRQ